MHANIFGFAPAILISNPVPPLKEMQEEKFTEFSTDFDRAWYFINMIKIFSIFEIIHFNNFVLYNPTLILIKVY